MIYRIKTVRPAKLALFIYVAIHYVEIFKQLETDRCVQLSRLFTCKAKEFGAKGHVFDSQHGKDVYSCFFVADEFFLFCSTQ